MPKDDATLSAASVGSAQIDSLLSEWRDMDENTTGAFAAIGVALAIFAVVIFTLPMPPKRRRN